MAAKSKASSYQTTRHLKEITPIILINSVNRGPRRLQDIRPDRSNLIATISLARTQSD